MTIVPRAAEPAGGSPPSFRSVGFIRSAKHEVDWTTMGRGGMECLGRKYALSGEALFMLRPPDQPVILTVMPDPNQTISSPSSTATAR